jgi:DNA modification methylase
VEAISGSPQQFKAVYFPTEAVVGGSGRTVTLAFARRDSRLFEAVRPLSSVEIRDLLGLGTWPLLQQAADLSGQSLSSLCVERLRERLGGSMTWGSAPASRDDLDPAHATYRGGVNEPMHGWFPLLEGYSPEFVSHVLNTFAPLGRTVLDPFAGGGTTPITVAIAGGSAYYCEINPVFQVLIESKLTALSLDSRTRARTSDRLGGVADRLQDLIAAESPDGLLQVSYDESFGASQFFDADVLEEVLRLRSAIDRLACTDPLLASLLTVAVLSAIVPASRLVRRGDLRYKTDKEKQRLAPPLLRSVEARLRVIADDLSRLPEMNLRPVLVTEDAKHLGDLPPLDIDAVITSPPYLNGTNYFRNTKMELWFLRCLREASDLTRFRERAVTAGINDVVGSKRVSSRPAHVAEVLALLDRDAYDRRIPAMVAAYFTDMETVFSGLRRHLRPGATVGIDIGDSYYGTVHVPTDKILTRLLGDLGYPLVREVELRRRMSRSGFPLRQVLLVYEYRPSTKTRVPLQPDASPARPGWDVFKGTLPHRDRPFSKRNWGNGLHSLCSYEGKMKPSLAHFLVEAFVPPGGSVLDPFAGVGTIPFEAALSGRRSHAFEISPVALRVAQAKLTVPQPGRCEAVLEAVAATIDGSLDMNREQERAAEIKFNGPLTDYFHPDTFREILAARRYFLELEDWDGEKALVFSSLLHILHGNRPYALSRRSHPITPFAPTGPTEYRPVMPRLRAKVERSLGAGRPAGYVSGSVRYQDATSWWPSDVDDLDAVITSPPFYDSTRFHLSNWMRLWFAGWESTDFRTKPLAFVDERQKGDLGVYEPILRQSRERLKHGGVLVMHLGMSRKLDMATQLARLARPWFKVEDVFFEDVQELERHGVTDKGTVHHHSYLVLS